MLSHGILAALLWLGAAVAVPWIPAGADGPPLPPSGGGSECHNWCGSVYIPYPFGIGPDHCSMSWEFHLDCIDVGNGNHKPFLGDNHKPFNHRIEVVNISMPQGQARVMNIISFSCYNTTSSRMEEDTWSFDLSEPYSFSHASNRFIVVGCRVLAYIYDDVLYSTTACLAICNNQKPLTNGACSSEIGCCQRFIPMGLQRYNPWFDDSFNTSGIYNTSPCSYAVLMEWSSFKFSTSYATPKEFYDSNHGRMPLVLDWVVGNETCDVASKMPGYACVSSNSECVNSTGGLGYICNCIKGFQGNPYLTGPDGCQDIDECKDNDMYPCHGRCINKPGRYECLCPLGTQLNEETGACEIVGYGTRLAIGISAGVIVAVIAFLATKVVLHKRRLKRQALFQQNGGQLLKHMLKVEGNDTFTIYDRGDILKATRNFHKANIIGEGAHGTVYKAILRIGGAITTVAVKRCKEIDETRKKEFIQELVILCHLNHPNIVRLLGCCLEFEAPMLVSEFLQNTNLNHLLHGRPRRRVPLSTRLRIAAESAGALAHLHSPPNPVLHGDVKPENILLANGWIAKVADFGCSTIKDNVQVVPKGTLAYLDPEFLQDFQLTDKSDVYSFGVVLVELLTGKKPRSKEAQYLTLMFQESMRRGTFGELLDTDIAEESSMVVIQQAAELGCRCLAVPGTARPSMDQVARELRRLKDQVAECSQLPPQELEDLGPTEIEMSTGYPTAQSQSEAPGGTYMG